MSGGSYDYLYSKMQDAADTLSHSGNPLRRAFAKKLELFAEAMHDIEWVDSCDKSPGDEVKAIEAALGKGAKALELSELIEEAQDVNARLTQALIDAEGRT
jgi:hypothetical protein